MARILFELVVDVSVRFAEAASASLFTAGVTGLEERKLGPRVRLVAWTEQQEQLAHWRDSVTRALGVRAAPIIEVRRLVNPDWDTRWVQHLRAQKLGRSFVVQPVTNPKRRRRKRNEILVVPRLAFGLGDHPTTQLAARAVERWARAEPNGSLLDVGCGTGLLCFVAVLSGARRALGIDVDRVAIDNARENAALNELADRCVFRKQNARALASKFGFVVANIDLPTLLELAQDLARLAPRLALTGILEQQAAGLSAAYGRYGLAVERTETRQGWAVLTLTRRAERDARWAARGKVATTRRARGF